MRLRIVAAVALPLSRGHEAENGLDFYLDPHGGFDVRVVQPSKSTRSSPSPANTATAATTATAWRFSPVTAREVWLESREAFGNFRFSPRPRSARVTNTPWQINNRNGTAAVLSTKILLRPYPIRRRIDGEEDSVKLPSLLGSKGHAAPALLPKGDCGSALHSGGQENQNQDQTARTTAPFNSTKGPLAAEALEVLVTFAFSLVDADVIKLSAAIGIPHQQGDVAPETTWMPLGTTKFMLVSGARGIELGVEWRVVQLNLPSSVLKMNTVDYRRKVVGLGPQYSFTDLTNKGAIVLFSQEQGAGRGKQPLTFFANKFYPYAGMVGPDGKSESA
eukprot:g2086.t1